MPMPSTPPPASSFQGLGNDPAGMLDAGTSRGDFVTRTWQPTPAPDSVAVEALMLGPLAKDEEMTIRIRPDLENIMASRDEERAAARAARQQGW